MSASALYDAIKQVQKYVGAHAGIKKAPANPPQDLSDFPFSLCYAQSGAWESKFAGDKSGLHNLVLEIHVADKLPGAFEEVMKYSDSIPNLLYSKFLNDNHWNNTIATFQRITYTFGKLDWGTAPTVGFRFVVEGVLLQSTIT